MFVCEDQRVSLVLAGSKRKGSSHGRQERTRRCRREEGPTSPSKLKKGRSRTRGDSSLTVEVRSKVSANRLGSCSSRRKQTHLSPLPALPPLLLFLPHSLPHSSSCPLYIQQVHPQLLGPRFGSRDGGGSRSEGRELVGACEEERLDIGGVA